jgi:hypothetical protein
MFLMFSLDIQAFVQYGYRPGGIMAKILHKQKAPLWFNPYII